MDDVVAAPFRFDISPDCGFVEDFELFVPGASKDLDKFGKAFELSICDEAPKDSAC